MIKQVAKISSEWLRDHWRPAMALMYMMVCIFDFIGFPILWAIAQIHQGTPITQWSPLTLQGAGLFHIAMGAVLGVTAWGRSQEKLAATENERTR